MQLALHNAQSAQAGSLPAAHLAVLQLHAAAAAAPRQSAAAWLAPAPASVPRGRRCGAAAACMTGHSWSQPHTGQSSMRPACRLDQLLSVTRIKPVLSFAPPMGAPGSAGARDEASLRPWALGGESRCPRCGGRAATQKADPDACSSVPHQRFHCLCIQLTCFHHYIAQPWPCVKLP